MNFVTPIFTIWILANFSALTQERSGYMTLNFIEAKKWLSHALRIVKKLEASSGAFIQDKRQTPFIRQLLTLYKVGGFYRL